MKNLPNQHAIDLLNRYPASDADKQRIITLIGSYGYIGAIEYLESSKTISDSRVDYNMAHKHINILRWLGEPRDQTTIGVETVLNKIDNLYSIDAIHVKRGYRIRDSTAPVVSNHMIEESVELQAAAMQSDPNSTCDEAADTLLCYFNLLKLAKVPFWRVLEKAVEKLDTVWTADPSQVTARRPGFTRAGRQDPEGGT